MYSYTYELYRKITSNTEVVPSPHRWHVSTRDRHKNTAEFDTELSLVMKFAELYFEMATSCSFQIERK